ncbi:hypothetical protein Nepgr_029370 [Nepenthes gracilis]|uniref:Uncharacterized protein n=1 Tax=Nepenthes gracilis TaxID=150966 RepID=A0AAD3TF84_NEPGR|nr:hypothetical protein Nepgr_029370 [Nepenthes gracilis]
MAFFDRDSVFDCHHRQNKSVSSLNPGLHCSSPQLGDRRGHCVGNHTGILAAIAIQNQPITTSSTKIFDCEKGLICKGDVVPITVPVRSEMAVVKLVLKICGRLICKDAVMPRSEMAVVVG